MGDVAIRNAMAAESKASASGGRAAGGGGGGIGDGFTNLAAEDSEDELRSSEWEARLASGDLPEDFLRVTEPKAENRGQLSSTGAVSKMGDPAIGNLVEVPGEAGGVAAAGTGATVGASATSPRRAALAAAAAGSDRGPSASGAIGGAPATNPSAAAAAAATASRRTLAEAESPLDDGKSSAAGDGDLPQSLSGDSKRFLSTEEQDRAMALALQEQLNMEDSGGNAEATAHQAAGQPMAVAPAAMIGRLTVTVVEAKLAKNYGLTRMDPYCRVRVGHSVYETPTCPNGAKEPKWNKTFACYLYQGIKNLDVEIYDECTFATDPQIASGNFPIPENVVSKQEVADLWLPLSGAEGEGKEGMIHIILSLTPIAPGAPLPQQPRTVPNVAAGGRPMTYTAQPQPGSQGQQQPQRPPRLTEEELEEFVKMFPNLDRDIIGSVHAASGGDKETMVNNLLQLGQQ